MNPRTIVLSLLVAAAALAPSLPATPAQAGDDQGEWRAALAAVNERQKLHAKTLERMATRPASGRVDITCGALGVLRMLDALETCRPEEERWKGRLVRALDMVDRHEAQSSRGATHATTFVSWYRENAELTRQVKRIIPADLLAQRCTAEARKGGALSMFDHEDPDAFLAEFRGLVDGPPPTGPWVCP